MGVSIKTLISRLLEGISYMQPHDRDKVLAAVNYAKKAHLGAKRGSGEPFIIHPINVALILSEYKCDCYSIIAALLHDVVEDTEYSLDSIRYQFGEEVAEIVDGLTKIKKDENIDKEYYEALNIKKLLMAGSSDIRVIVIKLADKLHNMRTLKYKSIEKQIKTAKHTLEFFVPLAERLSITLFKEELENLSFYYIDKKSYQRIKKQVQRLVAAKEPILDIIREKVIQTGITENKDIEIIIGHESYYNIFTKDLDINNCLHARIITGNVPDCFEMLGNIHAFCDHIIGSFEDNIHTNKSKFEKYLKTKVSIDEDTQLTVYIQTRLQQQLGALGVLSLILYDSSREKDHEEEGLIFWHKVIDNINKVSGDNVLSFYNRVFKEYLEDEIIVFTPMMDPVPLPANSTVIDFAYSLNPKLANQAIYAVINDKKRSIYTRLRNNDIVTLITDKHSFGPTYGWLKVCYTSHAIYEIKKQLVKMDKKIEDLIDSYIKAENTNEHWDPQLFDYQLKYARCCNPNPFDKINIKLSHSKKLKVVHTANCNNIADKSDPNLLQVDWKSRLLPYYEFTFAAVGEKESYKDIELLKKIQELGVDITEYNLLKKSYGYDITVSLRLIDIAMFPILFKTLISDIQGIQAILRRARKP